MDDDFNTARAIGLMFDTVRGLNRVMDDMAGEGTSETRARLQSGRADLTRVGGVLGIGTELPSYFFEQRKARALENEAIDAGLVESLIAERLQARQQKDWERADRIRSELSAMNIVLEDGPGETTWKVKS
jgi:cysteinyl-tRNA synthetase